MTTNKPRVANYLKTLALIVLIVMVWRLAMFGVASQAGRFFPYSPSFPYTGALSTLSNLPSWIYSWANFDGVHYLSIVDLGYEHIGLVQAFFPVYPILIELLVKTSLFSNSITSGLTISFIAIVLGGLIWWWISPLFLIQIPRHIFRFRFLSLFLLILFPTSFYFGAMYTEALFFLLSVSALALGLRHHFLLASILAGLASGTRVVGVFLVPALLLEYWWPSIVAWWRSRQAYRSPQFGATQTHRRVEQASTAPSHHELVSGFSSSEPTAFRVINSIVIKQMLISLAIIVMGSSGLWLYSGYLQKNFNDPLYFFSVQNQFGAGREESIVLYPQTAWRATKILLTVRPFDWKYYAYAQEFLVGTVGLMVIIWSAKYVKPSIWLFSLLIFLLPTLTGTFSSMPRYILSSYSVFLALAVVLSNRRKLSFFLLLLSTIWLILNTMLFIQGYWVA